MTRSLIWIALLLGLGLLLLKLPSCRTVHAPRETQERPVQVTQPATEAPAGKPPSEPEFNVFKIVQEEKRKALAEGRPPPEPYVLADLLEQKINPVELNS